MELESIFHIVEMNYNLQVFFWTLGIIFPFKFIVASYSFTKCGVHMGGQFYPRSEFEKWASGCLIALQAMCPNT